ncbi:MAG TPA: hypothetical protein VLJ68_03990 [Chitinophagaceae bacterium]|nr:hypothetical protein [Chitinophagaceae bacterium]
MKKNIWQSIPVLAAVTLMSMSFTKVVDHANFGGEWKLNEAKSELGNFGRFAAHTIKVDQKDDAITIAKTAPSFQGGDATTTETLTFDGKETESTVFGNSPKKSSAKWSDDGQTLTISYLITFERDGQTSEIKGTETWSLKDGSLSIVTNSTSSRGETTTKAIYNK